MNCMVTGAFGYSGRYIARRLLEEGHGVGTLTNSMPRDPELKGRLRAFPLNFADPAGLTAALRGTDVLINTYWTRFSRPGLTFDDAVRHTGILLEAARNAGVRRVVHLSITHPDPESPLDYFRAKARAEAVLAASGLPHSILRPTILFGREDLLINNIAWALRRLPVFGIFGSGRFRLQPVHVDDVARLAVEQIHASGQVTLDAAGPEVFTYRNLIHGLCRALGLRRLLVPVPAGVGYLAGRAVGALMKDVLLTRDEITSLMSGRLVATGPATGVIRLSEWMARHAATLGRVYASENSHRGGVVPGLVSME